MQFTTSDGFVVSELLLQRHLTLTIEILEKKGYTRVLNWKKEFLEWILDKEVGYKADKRVYCYIELNEDKDITKKDLERIKQFKYFLKI